MSEMLERVAKALAVSDGMHRDATSNDDQDTPVWHLYLADARAAIEAMREPTDAMCLAAGEHYDSHFSPSDAWPMMIDAALCIAPKVS